MLLLLLLMLLLLLLLLEVMLLLLFLLLLLQLLPDSKFVLAPLDVQRLLHEYVLLMLQNFSVPWLLMLSKLLHV
jgi:hypothetical protein